MNHWQTETQTRMYFIGELPVRKLTRQCAVTESAPLNGKCCQQEHGTVIQSPFRFNSREPVPLPSPLERHPAPG